jgi:copper/silver efflux system protein
MLLNLDLAFAKPKREPGRLTRERLYEPSSTAKRLRPKFMTFATMSIGLIPIFWSSGTGSVTARRPKELRGRPSADRRHRDQLA